MASEFDVIVIGGGGAGYAAASTAARHGARVAMVEDWKLGGTCLNVGCVPTKALLRSAYVYELVKRAAEFGIDTGPARLDFARVMRRKADIIAGFSGEGPEESLRAQGITWLRRHAQFVDSHTLSVGDRSYTSERFIVASGSRADVPDLPGLDAVDYVTSDGALELAELPRSIVIVGTGTVACEFASMFRSFGSEVSVVGRGPLPKEDADLTASLAEGFERRGIRIVNGRAQAVSRDGRLARVVARPERGDVVEAAGEVLMLATGRRARTHDLALPAAGVATWEKGIKVDQWMRTSAGNIWACGDVTGQHMYTHAGDYAAEVAGWNATHEADPRSVDWRVIPRPVFSFPEFAAVGLTEDQARAQAGAIEVTKVRFNEVTKPIIDGETEGFVKVIARADDGRILGAGIVGEEATSLISELVVAMAGNVSAWTLGDAIHPYPTLPEIVRWTADQVGKKREACHLHPAITDISEPMLAE
ncbi:MAG: dihydrolipoyl dehydrogenase family protein [Chloroflexota bacterium]